MFQPRRSCNAYAKQNVTQLQHRNELTKLMICYYPIFTFLCRVVYMRLRASNAIQLVFGLCVLVGRHISLSACLCSVVVVVAQYYTFYLWDGELKYYNATTQWSRSLLPACRYIKVTGMRWQIVTTTIEHCSCVDYFSV